MRIAVPLALAISCWAQTFPIAGTLVDAASGAPMNRVRIRLTSSGPGSVPRFVMTGADGKFSFDVPKGKFALGAEYRGMLQPYGLSGPSTGFGVALFTGPDQDTSHLVFKWFAPGAISGKVIDDRDEPVESALVQLIRVGVLAGHKIRRTLAWARTNDLGEYRFGGIAGGIYYLAVTAEPWYVARSQILRATQPQEAAPAEPSPSYAPMYYPNAIDPASAKPLELAAGAEVAADFRLTTVTGVDVHIHCPMPRGQNALISLISEGVAGVETRQQQVWLYGDDQIVRGVFPGHYLVTVDGRNGNTMSARQPVDIGGSDLTVNLEMQPMPKVRGKVVFKDPARRPRRQVLVRLVDEATGAAISSALGADGEFSFKTVAPGRRRVQISSAEGFYAAEVTAEGASVRERAIEIAPGAEIQLSIVAADEVGRLKGFVKNGDRPMAGVLAVLAPKIESDDPQSYRGFQTDSDGSFDYLNIPAGDYILFAAERLDLEYANAAAVRPYLASGKPVHIAARQVAIEDVSLTQPKE